MKNWVKSYHGIFEKKKIEFTHWIGAKLLNSKEYSCRLIKSLQSHTKYREEGLLYETACPKDLQVGLFSIAYIDSYFVEDFEKLEYGLEKVVTKFSDSFYIPIDFNKIKEWLMECSLKSYAHGTYNVGWFSLSENTKKDFNYYFDSFQIHLSHFSPSIISLIMIVKPSQKLRSTFTEMISSNAKQELNIKKISLKHGITSCSLMPGGMVREIEIDEFFLDANKYVVKFLRKYVGAGLAPKGPLKNIEVLKLKQSLKIISQNDICQKNFFNTLGKMFYHLPYYTDWYQLYQIKRSKHYNFDNYQALLSETDYIANIKEEKLEDIEDKIYHHFTFILTELGTLLSLESMLDDLNKTVINLRNKLTKHILDRSVIKLSKNSVIKDSLQFALLNETHFKYQRIYNELDKDFIKRFFSRDTKDLNRDKYKDDGKVHFTEDIFMMIDKKTKFIENQIQYLKTSYSDYIHLRFTKSNYNFQLILIILTIVLAVLTSLLVIQENTINSIKTLYNKLCELFEMLYFYILG